MGGEVVLNGLDPVLIFQFKTLISGVSDNIKNIPIVSDIPTLVEEPPIPIYLSENLTGLFIDSEDKNLDIETDIEESSDSTKEPLVTQKGVTTSVSINIQANKNSIGLNLLNSLIDQAFLKLRNNLYTISYLNGSTTVFRGRIQSYRVNQNADSELVNIQLILNKGKPRPQGSPTNPFVTREENLDVL